MTPILVLTSLLVILSATALLAKALDLWLGAEKKKGLERLIAGFHRYYSASDPKDAMYLPIFIIGAVYDKIFGKRIISSKAFYRSLWLTIGFLVITLGVTGIMIKAPFGMKTAPWDFSELSGQIALKTVQAVAADPKVTKESETDMLMHLYKGFGTVLSSFTGKIIYTLAFLLAVILPNALLNYATVVVNRLFLREILKYRGGNRALLLMLFVNLCFMAFASSLILLFLGVFAAPAMWPIAIPLFIAAVRSPALFMILFEMVIVLAWGVCSTWLKVSACVTLIPTILILSPILIGNIGRKYLKAITVWFIKIGLKHKNGFLAYVAVGIGIVATAIALLIKIL